MPQKTLCRLRSVYARGSAELARRGAGRDSRIQCPELVAHYGARYSLRCGHVIPPEGGNTEFADMRAAYDMLDPKTKALIEDLVCEHSRIFSNGTLGFSFTEEELHAFAPVRQRLVRTHRRTGRKSLYLSSHAGRILGWPVPEAILLLRELPSTRHSASSSTRTHGGSAIW